VRRFCAPLHKNDSQSPRGTGGRVKNLQWLQRLRHLVRILLVKSLPVWCTDFFTGASATVQVTAPAQNCKVALCSVRAVSVYFQCL
jgi:hypothetical protein